MKDADAVLSLLSLASLLSLTVFLLRDPPHARSKYRARSQQVTTSSNFRCSVRRK